MDIFKNLKSSGLIPNDEQKTRENRREKEALKLKGDIVLHNKMYMEPGTTANFYRNTSIPTDEIYMACHGGISGKKPFLQFSVYSDLAKEFVIWFNDINYKGKKVRPVSTIWELIDIAAVIKKMDYHIDFESPDIYWKVGSGLWNKDKKYYEKWFDKYFQITPTGGETGYSYDGMGNIHGSYHKPISFHVEYRRPPPGYETQKANKFILENMTNDKEKITLSDFIYQIKRM